MRRTIILLVLGFVIGYVLGAITPPAHAGGYGSNRGYAQQQYAAPYQRQYVEKVYYQFLPVLTPGEYYGGMVAGQLKQQKAQALAAEQSADLASRVDRLAAAVEALQRSVTVGGPGPLPTPTPMTPGVPAQPPAPPEPTGPAAVGPPEAVLRILSVNCAKCHTAPAKAGKGYAIFDAPDVLAALGPLDLVAIDQQTYSWAMPPEKPLPKEEYDVLRAWIGDHADEITAALRECAKNAATAVSPKGK